MNFLHKQYKFTFQMLVKGNASRGARYIRRTYEAATQLEAFQLWGQDVLVQDCSMEETDELIVTWKPV